MWLFYVSVVHFFFKQKTAYEMRISDWSSDVCSSDLRIRPALEGVRLELLLDHDHDRAGVGPADRRHRPSHSLSHRSAEFPRQAGFRIRHHAELRDRKSVV